jgi:predicted Zn finger-like uncharacterized protein
MTDSFVTQCPHCQTSFRVSHGQLSVARGMVRCGSCLQVFNAAKQLLEERAEVITAQLPMHLKPAPETTRPVEPIAAKPVDPEPGTAAIPELAPGKPPLKQEDHPVDLDSLDLDDLDVELARLEQRETKLPESFGVAGNRHDEETVESFSAQRNEPDVGHENWNSSLDHDDINSLPELHNEVVSEPGKQPHQADSPKKRHEDDGHRTEPSLSMSDSDIDIEQEPDHNTRVHAEPETGDPHSSERFSALDDDDERRQHDEVEEDLPHPTGKRGRSEPALRDQVLLDLTDDPLQLSWQKPKPRWGKRILWLSLTLIALGALAGQYVWYHFDELARQDQYRSLFQELCPAVGCKLPSKVDIKQLKSSNLVVRSHPEFQGALVVDAIIYNRAPFSQPFPLLELRFSDTNGQLIASRRFKPGEYLSGELAGKDEMPPQTPIHIALDILDPGPKAVNYSLSFRSPE